MCNNKNTNSLSVHLTYTCVCSTLLACASLKKAHVAASSKLMCKSRSRCMLLQLNLPKILITLPESGRTLRMAKDR